MNKWYIHIPESVLENETHTFLVDFKIQTDHLISARRPDRVIVNNNKKKKKEKKENLPNSGPQSKIKRSKKKKKRKKRKEKSKAHEGDNDTNCNYCTWNNPQKIDNVTRKFGNKRTNEDQPAYSIIKMGQNTEKSPGDLRRFAVTPLRNHRPTLV